MSVVSRRVETTLGQIVQAEPTLVSLCMQTVPLRYAYHLSRLLVAVRQHVKMFQDKRFALIKEIGVERDAKPGESLEDKVFQVMPERMREYQERLREVEAESVTINKWLLTAEQLGVLQVTGNDLFNLGPLVVLEEQEPK